MIITFYGKVTKDTGAQYLSLAISVYSYMAKWLTLFVFTAVYFTNQAQNLHIPNLELPQTADTNLYIRHPGFTLLYNEQYEQAEWVAYLHTRAKLVKEATRTDRFMVDPNVKTGSAVDADYKGSGYDRGHLAPAADMAWSEASMWASFYFSNMSPQVPAFNRGIWKQCEEQVRTWTELWDSVYVVTGPLLRDSLPQIGGNQVSVPDAYYKVLLHYTSSNVKAIGFIILNQGSKAPLESFAVSVDSVEKVTGINFFHILPDEVERRVEAENCFTCWQNAPDIIQTGGVPEPAQPKTQSVQCSATTQKGTRCKRMTTSANGKCHQHGGE